MIFWSRHTTETPINSKTAKLNSLGACVRDPEGQSMSDGTSKKSYDKGEKNEKPDKSERGTSLSIDRAAFLILRVKKAFKKKRQQRKDRL